MSHNANSDASNCGNAAFGLNRVHPEQALERAAPQPAGTEFTDKPAVTVITPQPRVFTDNHMHGFNATYFDPKCGWGAATHSVDIVDEADTAFSSADPDPLGVELQRGGIPPHPRLTAADVCCDFACIFFGIIGNIKINETFSTQCLHRSPCDTISWYPL